jgi:DNA-binding transcriptional MerR regulator
MRRIGELAAEVGLNPKTIRFYEAIGLLPEPQRTHAGYRLYDDADRERLLFIGKAKAIGLTLQEIGEILTLRGRGQQPCEHVRHLLDQKLAAVDAQLQALVEFRQELVALQEDAATPQAAEAGVCGIIEQYERAHPGEGFPSTPALRAAGLLRSG